MIITAMAEQEHWDYMCRTAECVWSPTARGIVVLDHNMLPCAGVMFDAWCPNSGQVHIAITNPLAIRAGFVNEGFRYFFEECDKEVMIGVTPANATKALKFNKKVGLREVYRVKDGFTQGIDLIIQEIRKDECRWINHGQEYSSAA